MLSVRDTGIGIPKDKQQEIFRPFSQGDSSTTRKFGGTGLGLAICGRLATLMGGAITVHSKEGSGAEFIVLIPLQERKENNPVFDAGMLQGKSAFVLDGNASFRLMFRQLLESLGLDAHATADLQELKAAWDVGARPDILFVSDNLPLSVQQGLSDLVATARPSELPHTVRLASPSNSLNARSVAFSFRRSLSKPVRSAALRHLLANLFFPASNVPEPAPVSEKPLALQYPLQILVVEDNDINRKIILQILKRLGYSPEVAENGKICLQRMASTSFDFVLMDIQMPEVDGYSATAALRKRGDTTWITALTADAMPEDSLRCQIAGMNDYLTKPIRIDTLRAALERCAIARKKLRG